MSMLVYFMVFHRSLWRRKSQPAPAFLPGKSHQPRSLTGYIVHGIAKSWTRLSNLHYRSLSLCSLLFDLFSFCSLDWIISPAASSSLWISFFAFSIWFWISKPEIQKISEFFVSVVFSAAEFFFFWFIFRLFISWAYLSLYWYFHFVHISFSSFSLYLPLALEASLRCLFWSFGLLYLPISLSQGQILLNYFSFEWVILFCFFVYLVIFCLTMDIWI